VVRRIKPEVHKVGGIVLPDSAVKKSNEGLVLATGTGALNKEGSPIPPVVKVGDRVLLAEYGGTDFEFEGEQDLLLVREEDILAILKK
jgi:chaperonin GroES